MPCSDGGYGRDDYDRIQQRADSSARAACEAIALLQRQHSELFAELSVETRAWWNAHQKADRDRLAREQEAEREQQVKRDALAKLSPEERRLLGIFR